MLIFQHINISFQHVLTSAIERRIAFTCDACSKPPIIIRSHDLCASDIKRFICEIVSYREKD